MGSINNIVSLVIGINLVLVGGVAFVAGIVSLLKKDGSIKKPTSIFYIVAGIIAVYVAVGLLRSSF